ncbi:calaxin-like [Physella acuta]|uniref:calaxin-like n=1 Tax=Physella acuta TaxID=109671 RepID=UPI0027DC3385|nr:calaxin-like [Physella acuta]
MSRYYKIIRKSLTRTEGFIKTYGLSQQLTENVLQYSKCLVRPNTKDIDDLIFIAEMSRHFKLYNNFMLNLMYNSLKHPKSPYMTVDEYARCIFTFLSDNIDHKIDLVFDVYDVNRDGYISITEMFMLLKPVVGSLDMDENRDESTKELVDVVVKIYDIKNNPMIDLEAFRYIVKNKEPLCLQLLGPCLPCDEDIEIFRQTLDSKSMYDIRHYFRKERQEALAEIEFRPPEKALYPIPLELP